MSRRGKRTVSEVAVENRDEQRNHYLAPAAPLLDKATCKRTWINFKASYQRYVLSLPSGEVPNAMNTCLSNRAFEDFVSLATANRVKVEKRADLTDDLIRKLSEGLHGPTTKLALAEAVAAITMRSPTYIELINYVSSYRVALKEAAAEVKDTETVYMKLFIANLKPEKLRVHAKNTEKKTMDELYTTVLSYASEMHKKQEELATYLEEEDRPVATLKKRKTAGSEATQTVGRSEVPSGSNSGSRVSTSIKCSGCQRNGHEIGRCPLKDSICRNCHKKGHHAAQCQSPVAVVNVASASTSQLTSRTRPIPTGCRYCAEDGHLVVDCPVRKRVLEKYPRNHPGPKKH